MRLGAKEVARARGSGRWRPCRRPGSGGGASQGPCAPVGYSSQLEMAQGSPAMCANGSAAAPPRLVVLRRRHWPRKGDVGVARVEEERRVASQGGGG